MRPLAILVAGEPVPAARAARGTFGQMIREAMGDGWQGPWAEVDAHGRLPDFANFAGMIVSGSPANVPTRQAWIVEVERYLARAVEAGLPLFGICFGHQLLGQALGGEVKQNPRGREIGTTSLELLTPEGPFAECPARFPVNMSHVDTIVALPPGARLLARTELDASAAVHFGRRAWGVQFHPEMDREIISHYVAEQHDAMPSEGLDPSAIAGAVRDTPESLSVLRRFAQLELTQR